MQGTFSRKLEKSREKKGNQGNIREITRKLYFRIYSTSYPHARRLKTRPKRTQCGSSVLHTTPASNGLHDGNFTSKLAHGTVLLDSFFCFLNLRAVGRRLARRPWGLAPSPHIPPEGNDASNEATIERGNRLAYA